MIAIGERVPALALPDDRGGTWRLEAERDRPLLVVFHRHFY
jgi:peroxiredoxin